jgi:hypothetical protein
MLDGDWSSDVCSSDLFEIHRIDLFTDNTAYNNTRGVYMIKDNRTGKEYFGVAGIGISELNAPATGPAQRHDEK